MTFLTDNHTFEAEDWEEAKAIARELGEDLAGEMIFEAEAATLEEAMEMARRMMKQ